MSMSKNIKISGKILSRYDEILSDEAINFIEELHIKFNDERLMLLEERKKRQIAIDKGENGKIDIWYVDTNYDGKPDASGIDTNGDGKPDKFKKVQIFLDNSISQCATCDKLEEIYSVKLAADASNMDLTRN